MSSPTPSINTDHIRQSIAILSAACREMTPAGAKPIPANPTHFNLLARPIASNTACHVCALPGHSSLNINSTSACRIALLSLITFWEDMSTRISSLYSQSERFKNAIVANKPTYEMRLDAGGLKGGDLEDVIVERLCRGWLKCASHFARCRARVNVVLDEGERGRLGALEKSLRGFLVDGMTLTELFERSIAPQA